MKYGKSEIIRRLSDLNRKGWANAQVKDLIDTLWRDEVPWKTSGFKIAGGTDAAISFNQNTQHFKIEPVGKKFAFYSYTTSKPVLNKRYEAEERDLSGDPSLAGSGSGGLGDGIMEEGLYLVYYDLDPDDKIQKLTFVFDPTVDEERDIYLTKVSVAWVYWDATLSQPLYLGDERHGYEWEPHVHWWAYRCFNGILDNGLELAGFPVEPTGGSNLDVVFSIGAGAFWHEDILHEISPATYGTGVPIFFFDGATGIPRITWNSNFLVVNNSYSLLYYNTFDEEEGDEGEYVMQQAADGNYVLCHVFATNCALYPRVVFVGQDQYIDSVDAILGCKAELDLITSLMPHKTYLYLGSVLYLTKMSYTNDLKAIIADHWNAAEMGAKVAAAIAEKAAAFKKTGWHASVQELVAFSYNAGSFALTISPARGYCPFFIRGIEYRLITTEAIGINGGYGKTYIYRDQDELQNDPEVDSNAWDNNSQWDNGADEFCMVAMVFYDPYNARPLYVGYEMHNFSIEAKTRGAIHRRDFTVIVSGLDVDIDAADNWKIEVLPGIIEDEDIQALITNYDSSLFGQPLWPLQAQKCYLLGDINGSGSGTGLPGEDSGSGSDEGSGSGSGSGWGGIDDEQTIVAGANAVWQDDIAVLTNVVKLDDDNNVQYNPNDPGYGWMLESLAVGEYTAVWVIATMDYTWPIKIILGSGKGATSEAAKLANPEESLIEMINADVFFCEEYVLIARIIVKNIAGAPYYEIAEINDRRGTDINKQAGDRYVKAMAFDAATRILTLERTMELPDLTAEIPGVEDFLGLDDTPDSYSGEKGKLVAVKTDESGLEFIDPQETVEGLATSVKLGYLYNGPALADIAPPGWHVPTLAEWKTLKDAIDSTGDYSANAAGGLLKEIGLTYWNTPNTGAANTYLFNGRGGGTRSGTTGAYSSLKTLAEYWCSDGSGAGFYYMAWLAAANDDLDIGGSEAGEKNGLSVRLVKDDAVNTGSMAGNDGKVYPTVKIGSQVWMACNLMETQYNDGSPIPLAADSGLWISLSTGAYCVYGNDETNAGGGVEMPHDDTTQKKGGSEALREFYHHTAAEHGTHVYEADEDGNLYGRKDGAWEEIVINNDQVIEFSFGDVEIGVAKTYDLDIAAEFAYTIVSAVMRTDTGTLTGVNVKINSTAVTSMSSITVSSSAAKTSATGANAVVAGDRVTLNITTGYSGSPTYIGGHILIQR